MQAVIDDAQGEAAESSLLGLLQVRQHTEHKRTFMFLEQVILKYNAAATCINIKDIHEVSLLQTPKQNPAS